MSWFSYRIGKKKHPESLQWESMDDGLRKALWNAVFVFMERIYQGGQSGYFFRELWLGFFNEPLDEIPVHPVPSPGVDPYDFDAVARDLKRKILRAWAYNEVYDFLEFLSVYCTKHGPVDYDGFESRINQILESHKSAYRLRKRLITPITDEYELSAIDEALADARDPFGGARKHLADALRMLSDRENPDYRNSIKESISAIESAARIITGKKKATLPDAFKVLECHIDIHPALKVAYDKLYAYTSDEEGLRHAMMDEPNISFEDAKYMLVSCAAFLNYLIAKYQKGRGTQAP